MNKRVGILDRLIWKAGDREIRLAACCDHRGRLQRKEFGDDAPLGILRFNSNDFGGDAAVESTAELPARCNHFTVGILTSPPRGLMRYRNLIRDLEFLLRVSTNMSQTFEQLPASFLLFRPF